ncbi:MAG: hypothetical protein ACR2RF_00365 [Geminicoccaceae bacterium]
MVQQLLVPQRPLDLSQLFLDKERLNALRATTAATQGSTAKQAQVNALLQQLGQGGQQAPVVAPTGASQNVLNQTAGLGPVAAAPVAGAQPTGGGQNVMQALLAADPATATEVQKFLTNQATEGRASREDLLKTTARELAQINALPADRRPQAYLDAVQRAQQRGVPLQGVPPQFDQDFVNSALSAARQAGFLEAPETFTLQPGEQRFDEFGKLIASREGATEAPKKSDIASFRKEFSALSRDFITARGGLEKVREAAKVDTGAGDVSLIFGFFKTIDPGSTIREGEFATAENTASVPDRVRNIYNRAKTGERLSPQQRADFAAASESQFQPLLNQQLERETQFTDIARRTGFDPRNVIPDFIGPLRPKTDTGGQASDQGSATPDLGQFSGMSVEQLRGVDIDRLSQAELAQLERAFDAKGL